MLITNCLNTTMLSPLKIDAFIISHESPHSTEIVVSTLRSSAQKHLNKITVFNHSKNFYETRADINIHFPHNPSLTRAWNTAIGMSSTDWTLISNDDVMFDNDWFETFLAHHEEGVVWHGASHCFLIHRDCIRKVGWFDEGFLGMYFEDLDYVRRMNHAKVKICYWQLCPMHEKIFHTRIRQGGCFDHHASNKLNYEYFKTKYKSLDLNDFNDAPLFPTTNYHWRTPWLLNSQS